MAFITPVPVSNPTFTPELLVFALGTSNPPIVLPTLAGNSARKVPLPSEVFV